MIRWRIWRKEDASVMREVERGMVIEVESRENRFLVVEVIRGMGGNCKEKTRLYFTF